MLVCWVVNIIVYNGHLSSTFHFRSRRYVYNLPLLTLHHDLLSTITTTLYMTIVQGFLCFNFFTEFH